MAQLEIYFVGLMCFIKDSTTYSKVQVLWDEDLEHVPFLYLGPTATNIHQAIPLRGTVSFGLPGGGPPVDDDPESPAVHLKPCITGNQQLAAAPPLAGTITLPSGIFGIALQLDDATIKLGSTTRLQSVSQIVLVSCPATTQTVNVLIDGQTIDTVSASSFVLIGNMSRDHDPNTNNHFQKYLRLTQGSTVATVTSSANPVVTPGSYSGNNFAAVSTYLLSKFPPTKTAGAPDCTITQWP